MALLVATALMIWFERKVISDMQSRIGPNRAGPWGLLQTLADGTKLVFKEDLLPDRADAFVFKLAPYLSVIPAVLVFTVVPVGGVITIGSHTFELQVADPPMGILLVLAMSGIAVYGVMLAGWSSGSKYPLLGSVRASAQVISYEAALGMTTVMVVLVSHSLSTRAIVASQSDGFWNWNLIRLGIFPFIFFMIAITAELTRPPFDLTEAEQELVGGFHTEYSSIRFGLFFLAEFMNTITMSAIVVTLFFGGPNGYIFHIPGATIYMPIIYFLLKTAAFCFIYVWFRAALPRLRYDQLMDLGWKRLIPLTLGWLLLVAADHRLGLGRPHPRAGDADRRGAAVPGDPARRGPQRGGRDHPGRSAAGSRVRPRAADHVRSSRVREVMRNGRRRRDEGPALVPGWLQADLPAPDAAPGHHDVPGGEEAEAAAPARPPRPQPLRGRHGEVHRLRAVRGRVPGRLHLRARARQPAGPPGVARRALRLRLRDQLPALHPLRHVRRGLPDRGDHRVQALRVLLHQPLGRHLHQGRVGGERRRHARRSCRGRTGARATTS